jgi:APA family basic amino acid/polyamine antiporter
VRHFRAPGGVLAPLATVFTCVLLMMGLSITNWICFFAWLLIGLVIYFGYSRGRSTLGREAPATVAVTKA